MAEAAEDADEREGANARGPRTESKALERLREILVGEELRRLEALEQRVEAGRIDPRELARALPDAVYLRTTQDDWLARSLERPVERALGRSIERNAQRIADVLKPLIGPLVRKGARQLIASMLEQFNRALEYSLTLKGLRWRLEARRTGHTLTEVVLMHSLEYRVEQVLLIHRPTGLLLQHVVAPTVAAQDPDVVAAMLTAINDFVQDSFPSPDAGETSSLQVGETRVIAQADERAILAAVVRGVPPADFNERLLGTLERIEVDHAEDFARFRGDVAPFACTQPLLEDRLELRFADAPRPRRRFAAILVLLLVLAALALLAFLAAVRWSVRDEFAQAMEQLEREPGVHLTAWSRSDGGWIVRGLRDPDARAPREVLHDAPIDLDATEFRLEPYLSLENEVLARRAARVLGAPPGVELRVADGVLHVPRDAPEAWVSSIDARDLPEGIDRVELEAEDR